MKRFLVLGLATLLTACGSGGSGSGVVNSGTVINPTPLPTPTSWSFEGQKVDGGGTGGAAVATSTGQYSYTYNGTKIDVTSANITAGTVVNLNAGDIMQTIGGTTYSYSRFGGVAPKGYAGNGELFYVGQLTSNMPTTGIATYKGLGVGVGDEDSQGHTQFQTAPLNFSVDFGKKTLDGKFDGANNPGITLETATIVGNKFSGVLKEESQTGVYAGAFYGPNAEELGGYGAFKPDAQGLYGGAFSFGGKKQ